MERKYNDYLFLRKEMMGSIALGKEMYFAFKYLVHSLDLVVFVDDDAKILHVFKDRGRNDLNLVKYFTKNEYNGYDIVRKEPMKDWEEYFNDIIR
jgi:hypothetical protein